MIKRALSYIFIIFGLVVLAASTSRTAMQFITDHRDGDKWWDTYPCMHGDLVSLCYLDFVPQFYSPHSRQPLPRVQDSGAKNTVLVMDGDSFTWHLGDSNFVNVSKFIYINRSAGGYYHLDSTKRNILIIEVSERYLRSYFGAPNLFNSLRDSNAMQVSGLSSIQGKQFAAVFPFKVSDFFNRYINQNLQCNLFNYNFIMPMFESKAALNYYVFNRASGDVVISNDRNNLFLKETVTKTDISSSYAPVSGDEIKQIVNVLNEIYGHYKKEGFQEVYFSIIPNAATIMQPAGYNNLIPAIQNAPSLKMKMIDIYSVFKNSPEPVYLTGDTHWNLKGKQMWVDMVNGILAQ